METRQFLASAPRGLADLLARELVTFGAESAKERSTGVAFSGSLRTAYRACLESRIANRVFLELGRFEVADAEGFYRAVRGIDWPAHFPPGATLACDFSGRHPLITHTHFGALKLKDAIVDSLREATGARPDIALDRPSVRVHAHANGAVITVSLDLSGESLHRRGYRNSAGEAPLKENVAAGMLMRSGWAEMAASGAGDAQFLDPMCGSGTLVIEAAMIAAGIAPGLLRDYYGFLGWAGHQPEVWEEVLAAARERARLRAAPPWSGSVGSTQPSRWSSSARPAQALGSTATVSPATGLAEAARLAVPLRLPVIRGSDRDRTMIRVAQANADRAGVGRLVTFEVRALADAAPAPLHHGVADANAVGGALFDGAPPPPRDAVPGELDSVAGAPPNLAPAPGRHEAASQGSAAGSANSLVWAAAATRVNRRPADYTADDSEDADDAPVADGALAPNADGADSADHAAIADSVPAPAATVVSSPRREGDADVTDATGSPPPPSARGLLCVNPPYGVRMEDHDTALATHRELGKVLRERFQGWIAGVLIGSPELGMELGIRAYRTHTLWNGALECRLLRLKIDADSERQPGRFSKPDASLKDSPGARMFGNRLGKNLKRMQTWASRSDVSCYRVYDADMPEYAFAIDIYRTIEPDQTWLYVQEYAAPAEIELDAVRRRRNEALSVMPEVTGVPEARIQVRTRRKNKRGEQYRKVDDQANFHYIREGGLKFRVNFEDYLDTGLFLDHRMTRARLREAASGKRFLNLFAYTGTATVYAAAGGAASTTTVDLSRTYLDWAQRNLALNDFHGGQHELVQADCREWLQASAAQRLQYDLIFLDPPTFSNSKRMEGVLDIERDHDGLIDACMQLLAPGGLLVFSTNAQKFKLDDGLAARYEVRDISGPTLPRDFERNPRIHRCFEVRTK